MSTAAGGQFAEQERVVVGRHRVDRVGVNGAEAAWGGTRVPPKITGAAAAISAAAR